LVDETGVVVQLNKKGVIKDEIGRKVRLLLLKLRSKIFGNSQIHGNCTSKA